MTSIQPDHTTTETCCKLLSSIHASQQTTNKDKVTAFINQYFSQDLEGIDALLEREKEKKRQIEQQLTAVD
jgi:hypothetical protein